MRPNKIAQFVLKNHATQFQLSASDATLHSKHNKSVHESGDVKKSGHVVYGYPPQ